MPSAEDALVVVTDAIAWTRTAKYRALPETAVPGTTTSERRALAALGALVAEVIDPSSVADADVPEDIVGWLRPHARIQPDSRVLNELADRLRAVLAVNGPIDALAAIYEGIIAGPNRRHLGTFFTPPHVVQHMLTLCHSELPTIPNHVIDPGAGVGAFTLAAPAIWPESDIHAIDINVVTLGMLLARPSTIRRSGNQIHHELDDFLRWLTTSAVELTGPRLFLGNPPYTRVHDMSPALRASAFEASGDLVANRLAGLSTHFTAAILRSLRPEDSTCLLIPGNWSYTKYGSELRAWLWTQGRRHVRLSYFPVETEVFPGTRVTAMILYVGPERGVEQPFTIERLRYTPDSVSVGSEQVVPRTGPAPGRFDSIALGRATIPPNGGNVALVKLGELVTTRRGTATGANHFFFVDDTTAERLGRHHFVPGITRATHVDGNTLTNAKHAALADAGHPAWLLHLTEKPDEGDPIAAYIAEGESHGLQHRYLTKDRQNWWDVEKVAAPDLLFTPFSRDRYRFIVNLAKAVPSNNLYGMTLKRGCSWTAKQLAEYLSSDAGRSALRGVARQYQGGSFKLEPREMLDALVPVVPPSL
ncbi:hypothetical protein [Nocardioides sp. SLBN-35]|uniref:hypothetical protein n=1 Tax=Nocardioides sp. SLBN-35 TaxID=2768445 RepID=UPI00115307C6|nr:hypothetical protein [Nocardioides sp. SLBN-35]TQK71663.1 hypothetical protein FBY23_3461 [Nocardioides sp. SLBN-35]